MHFKLKIITRNIDEKSDVINFFNSCFAINRVIIKIIQNFKYKSLRHLNYNIFT
jgi:hypothetical protein